LAQRSRVLGRSTVIERSAEKLSDAKTAIPPDSPRLRKCFPAQQSPQEVMQIGSYKQFVGLFFALALSAAVAAPTSLFQNSAQDQGGSSGQGNVPAKSKLGRSGQKNKAGSSGEAGSAAQTDAQGNANTLGVTDDARSRKNKTKVHRNMSGQGKNGSSPAPQGGQGSGAPASGANSQR
jgi:hypothetical protein